MSLIHTLSIMFDDSVNVDAINGEALLNYENALQQRIQAEGGALSETLRHLNALLPFFKYLNREGHREKTQSLYVWLLDWQLSTWNPASNPRFKHLLSVELLNVMKAFFEHKQEEAIQYYQANKEALNTASSAVARFMKDFLAEEVPAAIQTKTLAEWSNYFNTQLKGQEQLPTTILYLAIHYYQEPYAFAALIFWLFDRGVSPEKIIYSGLMHHFFEGHSPHISESTSENHPVYVLYDVLRASTHPGVVKLVETAEKTSAYVSDNLKAEKEKKEMLSGFQAYNLAGRQHDKETRDALIILSRHQLHDPVVRVNGNAENISALSTVFSGSFLKCLAASRHVAKQLTEAQWKDYVALVIGSVSDDLGSFPALFDLYDLLKRYCFSLRLSVFPKLFDLAVLHWRDLVGDGVFINRMRQLQCPAVKRVMVERVHGLIEAMYERMPAQANDLTLEIYGAIEAEWKGIIEIIEFTKLIHGINFSFFEEDIYQLQAKLLMHYSDSAHVFGVVLASYPPEVISFHKENVLMARLASELVLEKQNLIMHQHSDVMVNVKSMPGSINDLFLQACRASNVVLVSRFLQGDIGSFLSDDTIRSGFVGAARYGRVSVLELMFSLLGIMISQQLVDDVLYLIPLNYLEEVVGVFTHYGKTLHQAAIDKHFLSAASAGMLSLVTRLCKLNVLSVSCVHKALTQASAAGQLDVVEYLCDLKGSYAQNRSSVEAAFLGAIQNDNFNIAVYLADLPVGVVLSDKVIVEMIVRSVRATSDDMLHCILHCFRARFQEEQWLFGAVLTVARELRQWQRLVPLCRSNHSNRYTPFFIVEILNNLMVAGQVEVVAALCGITGEYDFDLPIFVETLKMAGAEGRLPFFIDVCEQGGDAFILKVLEISRTIHYGTHVYTPDERRSISNAVFSVFNWDGEKALEESLVVKALQKACDEVQTKFITTVCGFEAGGVLNEARIHAVLAYAKAKNIDEVLKLIILKLVSQFDGARPLLMGCLSIVLADKTMPEKYKVITGAYQVAIDVLVLEQAINLFNCIDDCSHVLGIDTSPRKAPFGLALFARQPNYGDEWAAAWGEMRQLVFNAWKREMTHEDIAPGRKQALMVLFEACGQPGSRHHKLMGMGRTSGKPHSKTSRLIEEEIAKVRRELLPRPH